MFKSKGLFFVQSTFINGVLPRCTNEYFLTVEVTFNLRFSLSFVRSIVRTTEVLYILLANRKMVPGDSNNIGILQLKVIEVCKGLSGASVLRVLWRYN